MSTNREITSICKAISEKYSACDVSDALLKLNVPQAGYLADISPIPNHQGRAHHVAPLSIIKFVPKASEPANVSNIPKDKHWTDCPAPGTIVLLQQPTGQVCAVCGDILATRLKVRGVKGLVADGRVRDIVSINELCSGSGGFTAWSRGTSTVGTGLEAKPWEADVPVTAGGLEIKPGDIICADEGERGCVVIPQDRLMDVMDILPALKEADEKCVADVQGGVDVPEAFRRHRQPFNPA